jgi:hypothetical protein
VIAGKLRLTAAYAGFAAVSIAANIGSQHLALKGYRGPHAIVGSMLVGTAVGLAVKYLLDRRFIFRYGRRETSHEVRTFALYATMGLATTAIFWAFEWAFELVFASDTMRYVGAVIGLCLGYWLKYRLDKHYVFR